MDAQAPAVGVVVTKGRIRWGVAGALFLVYLVAFFDRSNVSVLVADEGFTRALGIASNKSAQGLLLTAFLLCYGLACFVAGPVVQRVGARRALTIGMLSWAVLMLVMGSVSSFGVLVACRALLGIGEAVVGPSTSKLVQTWFPVQERAKANGIWYMGVVLSNVFTVPVVAWTVSQTGWRGSFYTLGLVGLMPIVLTFLFVYDDLRDHPRIGAGEVAHVVQGRGEVLGDAEGRSARGFLRSSTFWLLAAVLCLNLAGLWAIVSWLPTYLRESLSFSWAQMGSAAAVPYLVGTVLVLVLTPLMDRLDSRAPFIVACSAIFAVLLYVLRGVSSPMAAFVVLSAATGISAVVPPTVFTILQNVCKPREVAAATGLLNGCGFIAAAFMPVAMGALHNASGSFQTGFALLIFVAGGAALAGLPLVKRRL